MGLEVEERGPVSVGEGAVLAADKQPKDQANGVGEDVGVEGGEYLAFIAVAGLPGFCLAVLWVWTVSLMEYMMEILR